MRFLRKNKFASLNDQKKQEMIKHLLKRASSAPLSAPVSFAEVPYQILAAYEMIGHRLDQSLREHFVSCWENIDIVRSDLSKSIDEFSLDYPVSGTYTRWIPELGEIMRCDGDRLPKHKRGYDKSVAIMYRASFLIMTLAPIMNIQEILSIAGVGELYQRKNELPVFIPYTLPRNVEEATGLVQSIEESDDQVYATMLLAVLIRRHADIDSELWRFQLDYLVSVKQEYLDIPFPVSPKQKEGPHRAAYWMATSTNKEILERLKTTGSLELQRVVALQIEELKKEDALLIDEFVSYEVKIEFEVDSALSTLVDEFKSFDQWLNKNDPQVYKSLSPGLSRKQIDQYLSEIGSICLPEEVYALYQWHNGQYAEASLLVPGYYFFTFEQMIYEYKMLRELIGEDQWQKNWLPIMGEGELNMIVFCGDKPLARSGVYDSSLQSQDVNLWYESIHSMIKTVRECYEMGLYGSKAQKQEDTTKVDLIRRKYNPGAVPFTIVPGKNNFTVFKPEKWSEI